LPPSGAGARRLTRLAAALTAATLLLACMPRDTPPTLLITSDLHVSAPAGRWPQATAAYRSFMESLDEAPEILFVAGDVVDNVVLENGTPRPGGRDHWHAEMRLFDQINSVLAGTTVLHAYGPGHDFIGAVSLDYAAGARGMPSRGRMRWHKVDLVWVTVRPAVFSNRGSNPAALSDEDYSWLEQALMTTDNAVLLWHVPIRTAQTRRDGAWADDANLTIPESDALYPILERHNSKILAVFNGHIHKPSMSGYAGIPVFLCPFFKTGCHCLVRQYEQSVTVEPRQCDLAGTDIPLPASGG